MPRLRILPSARGDIVDILDFVTRESGSLAVGERFVADLRRRLRKLANLPGTMGRARPELLPQIRSSVFKDYVIFFRYRDDAMEIVNILHGHRDIDAFFGS